MDPSAPFPVHLRALCGSSANSVSNLYRLRSTSSCSCSCSCFSLGTRLSPLSPKFFVCTISTTPPRNLRVYNDLHAHGAGVIRLLLTGYPMRIAIPKRPSGVRDLSSHPTRMLVLSKRSESKDLSSYPMRIAIPKRPSGVRDLSPRSLSRLTRASMELTFCGWIFACWDALARPRPFHDFQVEHKDGIQDRHEQQCNEGSDAEPAYLRVTQRLP